MILWPIIPILVVIVVTTFINKGIEYIDKYSNPIASNYKQTSAQDYLSDLLGLDVINQTPETTNFVTGENTIISNNNNSSSDVNYDNNVNMIKLRSNKNKIPHLNLPSSSSKQHDIESSCDDQQFGNDEYANSNNILITPRAIIENINQHSSDSHSDDSSQFSSSTDSLLSGGDTRFNIDLDNDSGLLLSDTEEIEL